MIVNNVLYVLMVQFDTGIVKFSNICFVPSLSISLSYSTSANMSNGPRKTSEEPKGFTLTL